MSLDLSKLDKVKERGFGWQCQCPACAEEGLDKSGNHLRIYADGKFGCALNPGDKLHRQRIWSLAHGTMPLPRKARVEPPTHFDAGKEMGQLLGRSIADLAATLGLSVSSLMHLNAGWHCEKNAWAFPMRNADWEIVGIRLRNDTGRKWSVRGGREGLFWPSNMRDATALVVEGPTNTAAGVHLGWFTLGLPSARGGWSILAEVVRRLLVLRLVIIADNKIRDDGSDDIGLKSADEIGQRCHLPWAVLVLPCKDLRDFVKCGGTSEMLAHEINGLVWRH